MTAGTAPNVSTWDATPQPYRPGIPDFNGAALINDTENPPDPSTMPTAELLNTMSKLLIAMGKVVPNAVISVVGGNPPSFQYVTAAPSAVAALTLTLTRNAQGDVSITWPANTFPSPVAQAVVSLNVPGGLVGGQSYSISVENITNGVRVTTIRGSGLVDLSFTVTLH